MPSFRTSGSKFCVEYVESATALAQLSKWFILAALVLGVATAVIEAVKKAKTTGTHTLSSGTLKDFIEALRAFIQALAAAPAWIALFGMGALLFWMVTNIPTGLC